MSYGPVVVYNAVIASGATLSNEINLGKSWSRVYIDPTGAASEVRFQAAAVASASGGTYRQVLLPQGMGSTSTVQSNIWKVASGASGSIADAPVGFQYVKVETTAAVANGVTLKLICSD